VVVWVILLVVGYRGVMAIILNETPPANSNSAPAAPATTGFPAQEASAYALQFGQVYLNARPATASQRASDLASFLPPGATDPQLGWNGAGSLRLQSEQVAGAQVQDAHHATVTLLARVNGKLMELGVPVYAKAGGMVISGEPWLPAPKTVTPPAPQPVTSDDATQSALTRQLPAFFAAYASGDQSTLGRFLAPGTTVTGLGGSVVLGSVTGVTVPAGGNVRHIVATVVWEIPGQPGNATQAGNTAANLEMTYALTIVRQHGAWYVQSIAPSTQAGGQR
jgi:hypothetical protein